MNEAQIKALEEALKASETKLADLLDKQSAEIKSNGTTLSQTAEQIKAAESRLDQGLADLRGQVEEAKKSIPVEQMQKTIERLDELEKRFGRGSLLEDQRRAVPGQKTIGEAFVEMLIAKGELDSLKEGRKSSLPLLLNKAFSEILVNPEMQTKAAMTTTVADAMIVPYRDMTVMPTRRRLTMRNLMRTIPVSVGSVEYPRWHGLMNETASGTLTIAQTSGLATATTSAAHGLSPGDVVFVSGANQAGYNGPHRVIDTPEADEFTYYVASATVSPGTGTISWRVLGGGAAAETAEATAKPEARGYMDLVSALIVTIAHWLPVTRQAIDDVPQLIDLINNDLIYGLDKRVEVQSLYGAGSSQLQGVLTLVDRQQYTQAAAPDTKIDAIRRAATRVEVADGTATLAVVHPYDWEDMETEKGTTDHYILSAGADGSVRRVWRIPMLVTPNIRPLTALVGDFDSGVSFYDRQQAQVRFSEHHSTYFTENLLAVLAELRCQIAWKYPERFVEVTLL